MYMFARDTNFASLSTILQLYFETVLTVGYFCFQFSFSHIHVYTIIDFLEKYHIEGEHVM